MYTAPMLRTSLQSGPDLFDELTQPWNDLTADSPGATPFQSVEWQATWWRHYGRMREPLVVKVMEGGDLVGLMPFVRGQGLWRTLRPMGIGPSDYLHPLARPGYGEVVAQAIGSAVCDMKNVDLVDLHQIRETQCLATGSNVEPIVQATCLVLDLPDSYDAYLATLSKSLRYDVRKLDKSMFTTGRAKIETFGPGQTDRGLDILLELHRARWRKRRLPGAFLGRSVGFHRDWVRQAADAGMLWLSALHVDGEPIGAIYAMTMGPSVFYYQAGFDPAKGAVSPGTLLVASSIRRAIDEGKRHFDFMRGDEPYKRRWKPQRTLRNLRFLQPGSGLGGRVGAVWNTLGSRIEGRVRARLEGHGL
jgi:CelD/BcsL family acetyltransferase involved in cellulose biosynthesis